MKCALYVAIICLFELNIETTLKVIQTRSTILKTSKPLQANKNGKLHQKIIDRTHKNKISRKSKRNEVPNENPNTLLYSDASLGFKSAIASDIDDLTKTEPDLQKKGEISPDVENSHNKSYETKESMKNQFYNSEPANYSSEVNYGNKVNVSNVFEGNLRNAYDLVSLTALNYSENILEELRMYSTANKEGNSKNKSIINFYDASAIGVESQLEEAAIKINQQYTLNNNSNIDPMLKEKNLNCAQWSEWGPCNNTCGNGVSARYRDCYDTNYVKVPQHELKQCTNTDCKYCTEWSAFTACTKICGGGIKTSHRTCYNKDGSFYEEKNDTPCHIHPCKTECGAWSEWTPCSKECDTGVTVRHRNCTLSDGSTNTFYEHHSCNTQKCANNNSYSTPKVDMFDDKKAYRFENQTDTQGNQHFEALENQTSNTSNYSHETSPNIFHQLAQIDNGKALGHHITNKDEFVFERDGCMSAHIGFDKYQFNVNTIYDDTEEHNDMEYNNVILFNGNNSCDYSGVFNGNSSYMRFYDDIFRNFEQAELGVTFWLYPISISNKAHINQTLFSFGSHFYDFGRYDLILSTDNKLIFKVKVDQNIYTAQTILKVDESVWSHIAASFSKKNNKIDIYVNGKRMKILLLVESEQYFVSKNIYQTNEILQEFQGFGNNAALKATYSGVMDEIYVFKCELSINDVYALANMCSNRENNQCPNPTHGLCPSSINYDVKPDVSSKLNAPLSESVTPINS